MPSRTTPLRVDPIADAEAVDDVVAPDRPAPAAAFVPPAPTRRPTSTGIWVGLGVVVAGLALVVLGWGIVASKLELRDQLAPLVAAGIGGLAVVIVGLATLNAAVAKREEDDHRRQLAALVEVLDELRREVGK